MAANGLGGSGHAADTFDELAFTERHVCNYMTGLPLLLLKVLDPLTGKYICHPTPFVGPASILR
jgi:hypothetical protein